MLARLSIRDFVLIARLDLELAPGLCVFTGETGAGKSILLDALGLALGRRAEAGLVRAGAKRASATTVFATPAGAVAVLIQRHQRCQFQGDFPLAAETGAEDHRHGEGVLVDLAARLHLEVSRLGNGSVGGLERPLRGCLDP